MWCYVDIGALWGRYVMILGMLCGALGALCDDWILGMLCGVMVGVM